MSWQFKKIFSVAFALLFGLGIVLFAWKGGIPVSNKVSFEPTINNDLWKDSLRVVPQASIDPRSPIKNVIGTTTTAYLAHEFVTNYTRAQANKRSTPLNDADVQSIAQIVSEKAYLATAARQYGEQDIVVIPASTSTITVYKKELIGALTVFAQKNKTNEFMFVAQALDSNDASKLAPLADNIANYQALVDSLLAIHVPRTVLAFHLPLLQGYSDMLAGVVDMKETIADPVRGVQGITKYNDGAKLVDTAISMLHPQQ